MTIVWMRRAFELFYHTNSSFWSVSLYLSSLFNLPVLKLIGFSHIVFVECCHVHQFTNSPKKIWYTNIDNRKQIAYQSHKLINSFNAMCVMAIYLMPILLYHYIKHSTLPINFIWLIFVERNCLWSNEVKLIFTTIPCLGYRNVFIINIYHSWISTILGNWFCQR